MKYQYNLQKPSFTVENIDIQNVSRPKDFSIAYGESTSSSVSLKLQDTKENANERNAKYIARFFFIVLLITFKPQN